MANTNQLESKKNLRSKILNTDRDLNGMTSDEFVRYQLALDKFSDIVEVPNELFDRFYLNLIKILHKDPDQLTTFDYNRFLEFQTQFNPDNEELVVFLRGLQSGKAVKLSDLSTHKSYIQSIANICSLFSHLANADLSWIQSFGKNLGFDITKADFEKLEIARQNKPEVYLRFVLQKYKRLHFNISEKVTLSQILDHLIQKLPFIQNGKIFKVEYLDSEDNQVDKPAILHTKNKNGRLNLVRSGGYISDSYTTDSLTDSQSIVITSSPYSDLAPKLEIPKPTDDKLFTWTVSFEKLAKLDVEKRRKIERNLDKINLCRQILALLQSAANADYPDIYHALIKASSMEILEVENLSQKLTQTGLIASDKSQETIRQNSQRAVNTPLAQNLFDLFYNFKSRNIEDSKCIDFSKYTPQKALNMIIKSDLILKQIPKVKCGNTTIQNYEQLVRSFKYTVARQEELVKDIEIAYQSGFDLNDHKDLPKLIQSISDLYKIYILQIILTTTLEV